MSTGIPLVVTHPSTLFRDGLDKIFANSNFRPVHFFPSLSEKAVGYFQPAMTCVWLAGVERCNPTTNASVQRIVAANQGVKPVILASHQKASDIEAALEAGACGFLCEDIAGELLIKALELIVLGHTVIHPPLLYPVNPQKGPIQLTGETRTNGGFNSHSHRPSSLQLSAGASGLSADLLQPQGQTGGTSKTLSPRELLILRELIDGASNKAIARRFVITESTVKVHMKAIFRKLRLQNRTQAAVWARDHMGELQRSRILPLASRTITRFAG